MHTRILTTFLFLLALACGSSNSASTGGAGGSDTQEEKQAEAQSYGINEDVKVGDIRWKFLEVTDLGKELKSDNEFIEPKTTSGKFIKVRFEVENQGTEAASYAGIDLADNKDRTFKRYDEALGFIDQSETCILEQLNPNISKVCTEIFEVPADAAGLKASVGDLELLGGDEAMVDLGM